VEFSLDFPKYFEDYEREKMNLYLFIFSLLLIGLHAGMCVFVMVCFSLFIFLLFFYFILNAVDGKQRRLQATSPPSQYSLIGPFVMGEREDAFNSLQFYGVFVLFL
jgi:hypothetical protein